MKSNQRLGHEKATPAEVHNGVRSTSDELDIIAPSSVQPVGHDSSAGTTKGFNPKKKILIVDDDHRNVKLLAARLPMKEFDCIFAYEGKSAIEAATDQTPDLILLDVLMPKMDGLEVTRRLKNSPVTKDIPIILVTSLNGRKKKPKA
jgi:CheY-like chemotaxis protein